MTTPNYPSGPAATAADTDLFPEQQDAATGSDDSSGAKEKAAQTAGTAADEGKRVAGVAKQEAQQVAGEAKDQAQNLIQGAKDQLDDQSRTQRDRLVSTLQDVSGQLDSMASGEGAPSGMAQDLVRQVADTTRGLSSRIEGREPAELLDELRSFARRRPGTFLLGAAAAGLLAGRVTRGAKQAHDESSQPANDYGDDLGYAEPRGTAAGYPTAGTDYPPAGTGYPTSGTDYPTTATDVPATGTGYPQTDPVLPGVGSRDVRGGL